jgi:2-keto-4-pentenoate hydratase/2-oxohepta-3-ene-1,7-dioic acid hydratase in catechol pathway
VTLVHRREFLNSILAMGAFAQTGGNVIRYVRFRRGSAMAYGILEGAAIRELDGSPFTQPKETGAKHKLSEVKLLFPCEPPKVLAVGLNYKSHIGQRTPPANPELFYKPISALQNPEDPIVIPPGAKNVHYEGEMVLVIGRRTKNVSVEQAREAIFGVTCGNDVSERDWQNGPQKDVQWWRAKGSDTFGPLGPSIARGLDYSKLLLQTRLNGKVVQKQYTSDLLFNPPAIVSFASRYVTLVPGDVIYTGTPGATAAMKPGDVVEVEIEGIGVLRNRVVAA